MKLTFIAYFSLLVEKTRLRVNRVKSGILVHLMFLQKIPASLFFIILHGWVNYSGFVNLSLDLVRDLLTSWADNQYSSGMLQEALTSGCLGPTGKLGNCYFSFFLSFI